MAWKTVVELTPEGGKLPFSLFPELDREIREIISQLAKIMQEETDYKKIQDAQRSAILELTRLTFNGVGKVISELGITKEQVSGIIKKD